MANLLPRSRDAAPFPALDADQRARFEERARFVVGATWGALRGLPDAYADDVSAELEELDEAPSLAAAQALIAQLDAARRDAAIDPPGTADPDEVRWLLYRPGRSLRTGEAEIASRGFFDEADRPSPALWLEAIGRVRAAGSEETEVAILCAVPGDAVAVARAGREACTSGALAWVEELSAPLAAQLDARPATD